MKKLLLSLLLLTACLCGYGQVITTVAGNGCAGPSSGDGIPATAACIGLPAFGSFDAAGNYYFGENFGASRIKRINTTGIIKIIAGNGMAGFSGDGGPATAASIVYPAPIVDGMGNIYIADRDNYRVRKVEASTGIITTVAGNGLHGHSGDGGSATAATIRPICLCISPSGDLFVLDSSTWVRKISPVGIISTVAGNGIMGFSGDGGPATAAALNNTNGICLDNSGNILIGASGRVRKINTTTGYISTIAGNGTPAPYLGDGMPATDAQFIPYALAVDLMGNIFIADYGVGNSRVLKIDLAGIIHTVAGTGVDGFSGDGGPGTAAQLSNPEGVAVDGCGNVYIADDANRRIRKVTYPPVYTTPTISLSGSVSEPVGSPVTVTATVGSAGSSYIIHWLNHGLEFTSTTVPSVTYTKPAGIDTITARIVPTGWGCWDSTVSAGHVVMEGPTASTGGDKTEEMLRMWPNPVADVLHVSGNVVAYRITTIVGALVQQGGPNAGNTIPVNTLPAAMYLLEVTTDTGQRTVVRMVKQ